MNKFSKSLLFGFILGVISPILGVIIFYLLTNTSLSLTGYINHLLDHKLVSHVISLGAISNLLVFFIFIWTNYLRSARGVVFATMLYAILVAISKFI